LAVASIDGIVGSRFFGQGIGQHSPTDTDPQLPMKSLPT
jgi:hypothetical protein